MRTARTQSQKSGQKCAQISNQNRVHKEPKMVATNLASKIFSDIFMQQLM